MISKIYMYYFLYAILLGLVLFLTITIIKDAISSRKIIKNCKNKID